MYCTSHCCVKYRWSKPQTLNGDQSFSAQSTLYKRIDRSDFRSGRTGFRVNLPVLHVKHTHVSQYICPSALCVLLPTQNHFTCSTMSEESAVDNHQPLAGYPHPL